MLQVTFTLVGASRLGFSKRVFTEKNTGESHDAFEKRTWREKAHTDADGNVMIHPMAIKMMLEDCARYLSESVPGKGKATWTKHFEAGVMVDPPYYVLDGSGKQLRAEALKPLELDLPSDGKKGGSTRVMKTFPIVEEWQINGSLYLLDPLLIGKPEKVKEYLGHAGKFIGLGWYRPRRGGFQGRFDCTKFETKKLK